MACICCLGQLPLSLHLQTCTTWPLLSSCELAADILTAWITDTFDMGCAQQAAESASAESADSTRVLLSEPLATHPTAALPTASGPSPVPEPQVRRPNPPLPPAPAPPPAPPHAWSPGVRIYLYW